MKRREYLVASSSLAMVPIGGCTQSSDTGEDDEPTEGGNDQSADWEYEETVSSNDGDIHSALIGELESGDQIQVEVVVKQGRYTRFELFNRDTGEFSDPTFVYRDSRIEGYEPDSEDNAESPYRNTYPISEFGEYAARVTLLARGLEVTLRYRRV